MRLVKVMSEKDEVVGCIGFNSILVVQISKCIVAVSCGYSEVRSAVSFSDIDSFLRYYYMLLLLFTFRVRVSIQYYHYVDLLATVDPYSG